MPLLTLSKKVPLEGHFRGRLEHGRRGPNAALASDSAMLHNRRDGLA